MATKPRKAFDGIARPQGFIDDAAKVLLKASKRVVNIGKKGEASMLSPMSKKKFEKIYGPVEPNPRFASPKVQQQVARSMTKRRSMAKTEQMAKKYYGKK